MVAAPLLDSSSGWAWTAISRSCSVKARSSVIGLGSGFYSDRSEGLFNPEAPSQEESTMTAVREQLPEGRYGSGRSDAQADRTLKRVGVVLAAIAVVLLGWYGWAKIAGTQVSGEVIAFQVVSDQAVQVHLEVRKDAGVTGVCTLRSVAEDGTEVGRRDVRLTQHTGRIDTVVTIRTTARGTSAELVGCQTG
jgi:hypothetical protein